MIKAEDLVLELLELEKAAGLSELERGKFHAKLCEKRGAPDLYGIGADALSRLVRSVKFMDKAMLRDWFESQIEGVEQPLAGLLVSRSPERGGVQ